MRARDALRDIRGFASAGRIVVTRHARVRMGERSASYRDVRSALETATACDAEPGERWKVTGGVDLDGDPLGAVVVLEAGVVVVTVL